LGAAAACPVQLKAIALAVALIQSPFDKAQALHLRTTASGDKECKATESPNQIRRADSSLDGADFGVELLVGLTKLLPRRRRTALTQPTAKAQNVQKVK